MSHCAPARPLPTREACACPRLLSTTPQTGRQPLHSTTSLFFGLVYEASAITLQHYHSRYFQILPFQIPSTVFNLFLYLFIRRYLGPSRVYNNMMHIADWLPTFLSLAGGSVAALQLDGVSHASALSSALQITAPPRDTLFIDMAYGTEVTDIVAPKFRN